MALSASDLDTLYAVPPAGFIAARKELSARVRKAGDEEGAARVAALPKPTLAAWAVNQLYRMSKRDFDRLRAVGAKLRDAHRPGASGVRDLSTLQQAQRAAIGELSRSARSLLGNAGLPASESTLARVGETLGAISTLDRWGDAEPGRLSRELPLPGFDALLEALGRSSEAPAAEAEAVPAPPLGRSKRAAGSRDTTGARREAAEARRAAQQKVAEAQGTKARAEARLEETRRAAAAAARSAEHAENEARRSTDAALGAANALARAERAATEAAKEARAAASRAEAARASSNEAKRAAEAAAAELRNAGAALEAALRAEGAQLTWLRPTKSGSRSSST